MVAGAKLTVEGLECGTFTGESGACRCGGVAYVVELDGLDSIHLCDKAFDHKTLGITPEATPWFIEQAIMLTFMKITQQANNN